MRTHFLNFAAYNEWANARIYDSVSPLDDEAYKRDRGMFFKSFHGTLNHLLVTDYMWLHRIEGEGPIPQALDEILHENFDELGAVRAQVDKRIIDAVGRFEDSDFSREYSYTTISYGPRTDFLGDMFTHLFNHQTHHRGQIHNCLTQEGLDAPPLDLILFKREKGQ